MATELGIHTSTVSRSGTLTVVGVVATSGTLVGIPFVELTIVATVACGSTRTSILAGAGTFVTVSIAATILTVLGEHPAVAVTDKDIVANTLQGPIGTGSVALTVATNARHVRGVTTVVATGPGVLVAIKVTVTAVAVPTTPACSVTLVGILHTVVAVTSGSSTTVRCVTSLRVPVPVLA